MLAASKRKAILASVAVVLLLFIFPVNAQVVPEEWVTLIEDYLTQVDIDTTAEIVVYVLPSLTGHDIRDRDGYEINEIVQLGVYIFNELPLDTPSGQVVGIGKKGLDNGVLVLVAMEEREWRIEVGYGLEGDITDIEANLIAQQYLIPEFRVGNYGEGLYDTVVALSEEIPTSPDYLPVRGRYFYENANPPEGFELPLWAVVVLIFLGAVAVLVVIVVIYLLAKGKIRVQRTSSRGWGRGGGGWGGSSGGGRGGGGGGGGSSGGGGAGGKW